jgi:hypothetical protein
MIDLELRATMAEGSANRLRSSQCHGEARSAAILTVTHGHTNRSVAANGGYARAEAWAKLKTTEEMLIHPACEEFRSRLSIIGPIVGESGTFFRRREINGPPLTSSQMGPPPLQQEPPAGGRYNRPGERVLYLSDCEHGVEREIRRRHFTGTLYIQRYRLPLETLRIADFTNVPADDFLAAVLSKAEECEVAGRSSMGYEF